MENDQTLASKNLEESQLHCDKQKRMVDQAMITVGEVWVCRVHRGRCSRVIQGDDVQAKSVLCRQNDWKRESLNRDCLNWLVWIAKSKQMTAFVFHVLYQCQQTVNIWVQKLRKVTGKVRWNCSVFVYVTIRFSERFPSYAGLELYFLERIIWNIIKL